MAVAEGADEGLSRGEVCLRGPRSRDKKYVSFNRTLQEELESYWRELEKEEDAIALRYAIVPIMRYDKKWRGLILLDLVIML